MPHMPCFPNMVSLRVKLRREENQEEEEGMAPKKIVLTITTLENAISSEGQRGAEHDR